MMPKKPTALEMAVPRRYLSPAKGSHLGACATPCHFAPKCVCAPHIERYAKICTVCQHPIGDQVCWVLEWRDGAVAHLLCVEAENARKQAILESPWIIEAAAKRLDLSIEQFKALPNWERERHAREETERSEVIV